MRPAIRFVGLAASLLAVGVVGGLFPRGQPAVAQTQPADRVAVVQAYFNAQNAGDVDGALAYFTDTAVFQAASGTGACSQRVPCTDPTGVRAQIANNVRIHDCKLIRTMVASGAVVSGSMEERNDPMRGTGVERTLQGFLAQVPDQQIALMVIVNDVADPATELSDAIRAGEQPAQAPIPNPTAPCGAA